ncbi:DUF2975 domain-containing protein [Metaclostridioides mangenotii]|uniref:DUF2975 domain-containing protein n=1 Tax=Metaclostridioides mangenotii TaxID=1540 RepID=UPI000482D1B8|nr:DUF2975 domain-containing protein [Clostridioides mangenotii]
METRFFRNMLSAILHFSLVLTPILGIVLLGMELNKIVLSGFTLSKVILFILFVVYIIGFFVIILNLNLIVKSIENTPFIKENVNRFKIIGYFLSAHLGVEFIRPREGHVMWIIGIHKWGITPSTIVYIILALLPFVIAEVFDKAIKIKDENDLTI